MRLSKGEGLNFDEAARQAAANRALAKAWRRQVDALPGGLAGYWEGLTVASLEDGDAVGLEAFYAVLEAGILPGELVPITDFSEILHERNDDARMAAALGPYRYFCLSMRDANSETIGVSASVVFRHCRGKPSLHTSYLALIPARRGFGLADLLLDATIKTALSFLSERSPDGDNPDRLLHFIETNAMANMTLHERLLDEAIAMHPLYRDAYWQRQGFREIEGALYRQRADPPIALALKTRCYRVPSADNYQIALVDSIPAGTVIAHVRAFDNLLLNYDEATARLLVEQSLDEPQNEGLLGPFDTDASLVLMSDAAEERKRAYWNVVDADMARRSGLPMDRPLGEIASLCLGQAD